MRVAVLADPEAAAQRAAEFIAAESHAAVAARGRFIVAVSGGSTPKLMLRALAQIDIPWSKVHLLQVDERVAPAGVPERNLTHLDEDLLSHAPIARERVHAMPVDAPDLDAAAASYARTLRELAGSPPVLDLVHLGLGLDGHTASLVPGDPALNDAGDVALAGPYQGRRRMTFTYPTLDHARRILWVITGCEKAAMLARLCAGDRSIPAGRVRQDQALLLADTAAASALAGRR